MVEVLAFAPTLFFHCRHCELVWHHAGASKTFRQEQLACSMPDDLRQEYQRISDWVREMVRRYGLALKFRVIDAASMEGWFKSVRYGVHQYPAIIVDRKTKADGADLVRVIALIEQRLARPD